MPEHEHEHEHHHPPGEATGMLLQMLKGLDASEEFFEVSASIRRKLFDALLRVGFTEDQAVQMVAQGGVLPK